MAAKLTNQELALEILAGKWGNGVERREKVTAAGYDYMAVQNIVNALVKDGYLNNKPEQQPEPDTHKNLLEIDYDPQKHDGIQVNVLV